LQGTITRYVSTRAFGFITAHNTDYFFHLRDFETAADPVAGMPVSFIPTTNPKGEAATHVKLVTDPKERAWAAHEEARADLTVRATFHGGTATATQPVTPDSVPYGPEDG
jgi:cold shock CspA family protein